MGVKIFRRYRKIVSRIRYRTVRGFFFLKRRILESFPPPPNLYFERAINPRGLFKFEILYRFPDSLQCAALTSCSSALRNGRQGHSRVEARYNPYIVPGLLESSGAVSPGAIFP